MSDVTAPIPDAVSGELKNARINGAFGEKMANMLRRLGGPAGEQSLYAIALAADERHKLDQPGLSDPKTLDQLDKAQTAARKNFQTAVDKHIVELRNAAGDTNSEHAAAAKKAKLELDGMIVDLAKSADFPDLQMTNRDGSTPKGQPPLMISGQQLSKELSSSAYESPANLPVLEKKLELYMMQHYKNNAKTRDFSQAEPETRVAQTFPPGAGPQRGGRDGVV